MLLTSLFFHSPSGGSLRFDTGRIRRNIQKQFSRTREKMRGEKAERNDDDYLKKCEIIVTKKQVSVHLTSKKAEEVHYQSVCLVQLKV